MISTGRNGETRMPKYIASDGSTFEIISIEEAKKEINANGGEDKESILDKLKDQIYYWWNGNSS